MKRFTAFCGALVVALLLVAQTPVSARCPSRCPEPLRDSLDRMEVQVGALPTPHISVLDQLEDQLATMPGRSRSPSMRRPTSSGARSARCPSRTSGISTNWNSGSSRALRCSSGSRSTDSRTGSARCLIPGIMPTPNVLNAVDRLEVQVGSLPTPHINVLETIDEFRDVLASPAPEALVDELWVLEAEIEAFIPGPGGEEGEFPELNPPR